MSRTFKSDTSKLDKSKNISIFKFICILHFLICQKVFAYVLSDHQPVCNRHLRMYASQLRMTSGGLGEGG